MKLKKNKFLLFSIVLVMFSTSCGLWDSEHGECLDEGPIGSVLVFKLLDKNSKDNLIAAWGTRYDSDKVNLYKENGDLANELYIWESGKIVFLIPDNNVDALEKEEISVFYLHLPDEQGNLSRDIDTLSFTYEFENREGCPEIWYQSFKVKFNDSLYHQGDYETNFEFLK